MRKFLFLVTLLSAVGGAWAQPIEPSERIPLDPEVRVGRLDNGMTYYIRHNDKPAGQAEFYIVHDVGALQEEDSQNGLAHFLEHLAFNGTANLPGKTARDWTQSIGAMNINASTGLRRTVYMLPQMPLKRESIIDSALLVLHDWSGYITLKNEEIDNERGVVIEEARGRNSPNIRIMEKTAPVIYKGTRYGIRNLIGKEEYLRTFPYKEIKDFYKRWYRPDLQAVIIVGDFDVDAMEARVRKVMGGIPAAVNPEPKQYRTITDNVEPVVLVATDPELTYSNVSMYIKHPAPAWAEKDLVSRAYEKELLGAAVSMTNLRFDEIARQSGARFSGAAVGWSALGENNMGLTMGVSAPENKLPGAFEAAYTELERIRRHGFTRSELALFKANYLNNLENSYATRGDRRSEAFVNAYIDHFTDNTPAASAEENYRRRRRFAELITVEQVNKAFGGLIIPTNNVIVAVTPEKEGVTVPTSEELLAAVSRARAAELKPREEDKLIDEPLVTAAIKPGKVKKQAAGMFGSTVWTLRNGVRVVVKPSDLRANQVQMSSYAHGGLSMLADEDYRTAANMLIDVVGASGVGKFTQMEMQKLLAGKSAKATPSLSRFASGVNGNSTTKDIETMLQLTWLYFNEPRFDRGEFDRLMLRKRIDLQNRQSTPEYRFKAELDKTIYGDNVRAGQLSMDNIGQIDFDRLQAIYNKFFSRRADNYTFYFVGDFTMEQLRPLVEKYLGSLPTGGGRLAVKEDGLKRRGGVIANRFETPMEAPKSSVCYIYSGTIDYTLENSMTLSLMAGCLNARYFESIREEKGGTYGVRVESAISRQPEPSYELKISFDTDPALVDELLKIVDEELRNMAARGPRQEDINISVEYWAKSRPEQLKNNEQWMGYLRSYYTWGQDWNTSYDQTLASLDGEKVQALARKILAEGNVVKLIMSPSGDL